jgi:mannose-6-phosphate isomerase-like protein (cupin superfamily)
VGTVDGRVTPTPPFPGGVGLSHLRVYDTTAPDGLAGGTPHLHTVCTEAYAVVAGTGSVQTLTAAGPEEVPLEPGAFVWFTPGTIHRLVNRGGLEILVLMANAGLPEAGDMVITFPPDVVRSAEAYGAAATLPDDDRTTAGPGDAPRRRRDAAVPEFLRLVAATDAGDPGPLRAFHHAAAALVRPRLAAWERIWRDGPLAAAERTGEQLAALAAGVADHLADASVHRLPPPPVERRLGCCGTLGTYVVAPSP